MMTVTTLILYIQKHYLLNADDSHEQMINADYIVKSYGVTMQWCDNTCL